MKEKKLNISLDKVRLVAACLIIMVHTFPLESLNANISFLLSEVFCRIAVPLFLMITGYFIIKKSLKDKKVLVDYTKKVLLYYVISIIVYLPINIYNGVFANLTFIKLIKGLLVTGTFYHLWYFPALILGIWITYFILKNFKEKQSSLIFVILFTIGLLGDSYFGLIKDIRFLENFYDIIFNIFDYTRNGLFYCPMFLYLGYLTTDKKLKIEPKKNIILIIISLILMLIEGNILHNLAFQRHTTMYLCLVPLMIFLFMFLVNNQGKEDKFKRRVSTVIYIIHPWFIVLVVKLSGLLHLNKYLVDNSIIHFLIVFALTLIFSFLFEYLLEKAPKKKNNKTKKENKKIQSKE